MAFIDIKDPEKRNEIIRDYFKTVNEIRTKNENDKAQGLVQRAQLETNFEPLIKATRESTKEITQELKSNRNLKEKDKGVWNRGFAKQAFNYYSGLKTNLDKYFGIQKKGDHYVMGDKTVSLDSLSNIIVEGQKFEGTSGLWALIMLNKPTNFTEEDFKSYQSLLERTQAIFRPLVKNKTDQPKRTAKYRDMLKELEQSYDDDDEEEEEEEEGGEKVEEPEKTHHGEGVNFLPGDISGLLQRFRLLLASRHGGNIKSTTNEIVAILDELLRRHYLTREDYNKFCEQLSC